MKREKTIRPNNQQASELQLCKKLMKVATDAGAYKRAVAAYPGQCEEIKQLKIQVNALQQDKWATETAIADFFKSFKRLADLCN